MNRPIKFRAYSFFDKAFHYFDIEDYPQGIYGGLSEPQQFTGLTLPNGQDIYEGDILNTKAARWEVVFERGAFRAKCIWSQNVPIGLTLGLSRMCEVEYSDIIPLGNRFEHPELLTLLS